jgi:uncharacterized protein (DUF58 family)
MGIRFLGYFSLGLFSIGILSADSIFIALSLLPFSLFWLSFSLPVIKPILKLTFPTQPLTTLNSYAIGLTCKRQAQQHFINVQYPDCVCEIDQNNFAVIYATKQPKTEHQITLSFNSGQEQWPHLNSLSCNVLAWRWVNSEHDVDYALSVRPKAELAPRMAVYSKHSFGFSGTILSKNKGSSCELSGIGDYQQGHDFRHINWRASAKYEERLLINEFVLEQMSNIHFLIDAGNTNIQDEKESLFDYSKQAILGLAHSFDRDGHRLNFHIFGQQWQQQRGGSGMGMLLRLENTLSQTKLSTNKLWSQLPRNLNKLIPKGQLIVVVASQFEDNLALYNSIRAQKYPCIVISPDPISLAKKWADKEEGHLIFDTIFTLKNARRQKQLMQFKALNIPVLNWQIEQSLSQSLLTFQTDLRLWHRQMKR